MSRKRCDSLPECPECKQLCFAITGDKYCTILNDTGFFDKQTGLAVKCPFYQNMNSIYIECKNALKKGVK